VGEKQENQEDFAPYRTHKGKYKRATAPTKKTTELPFLSSTESAWLIFLVFVRH
jgi:hypothetical protein